MKTIYVKIEGIHCSHCVRVIREGLLKHKNIKEVSIHKNIATICYQGQMDQLEIIQMIVDLGYFTRLDYIHSDIKDVDDSFRLKEFLTIVFCFLVVLFLLYQILGERLFSFVPNIHSSKSFGMLFVVGLLTGVHCVSMCGAISFTIFAQHGSFRKQLFYHLGRVCSYTMIGFVCGALGQVLQIRDDVSGVLIILASCLMAFLSLSMLGLVSLPKFYRQVSIRFPTKKSFVVGLLNGFMPCSFLQALEVYAVSVGNPFYGALVMFFFGLGTVFVMLGASFLIGLLKGRRRILMNKVAAVLVLFLSFTMFYRGLLFLSIDFFPKSSGYHDATIRNHVQTVSFDLDYNHYLDFSLKRGVPAKIIIHVRKGKLIGCNREIVMKEFGIRKTLHVGRNEISFTPKHSGTFSYTCSMNMIKNTIKVVD